MTREELERIDEHEMNAWNAQDPDEFLALFADDFVWRDVTEPEPITTREAAKEYMRQWFTAFPDARSTATNRVFGDDAVAAEIEFTGTNTGPLSIGGMEIPATGKSVVGHAAYFARVRDGKVTEFSTLPDAAGLMVQLGLMPQQSQTPST